MQLRENPLDVGERRAAVASVTLGAAAGTRSAALVGTGAVLPVAGVGLEQPLLEAVQPDSAARARISRSSSASAAAPPPPPRASRSSSSFSCTSNTSDASSGGTRSLSRPSDFAVQRQPVEAALDRIFQRAVRAGDERRRLQARGLLRRRAIVEQVRMQLARERVVAALEIRGIDGERPGEPEEGEEVRLSLERADDAASARRRAGPPPACRNSYRDECPSSPSLVTSVKRHRGAFAPAQTVKDAPQPHARLMFGLRSLKPDSISPSS